MGNRHTNFLMPEPAQVALNKKRPLIITSSITRRKRAVPGRRNTITEGTTSSVESLKQQIDILAALDDVPDALKKYQQSQTEMISEKSKTAGDLTKLRVPTIAPTYLIPIPSRYGPPAMLTEEEEEELRELRAMLDQYRFPRPSQEHKLIRSVKSFLHPAKVRPLSP